MATIAEDIQARGERMTMPRRLVIEALGRAHQHMTIADIQQHIQEQGPDLELSDTTVYRVLQWLKDLQMVSQTDIGQSGMVYALIDQPTHHHLICLDCGETYTVADEVFALLREKLLQDYGFEARMDHMAVYGRCRQCQSG